MALQITGPISIGDIYKERMKTTTVGTNISLSTLSQDITNHLVNSGAHTKPNKTIPHSMSEFRGYIQRYTSLTIMVNNISASGTITSVSGYIAGNSSQIATVSMYTIGPSSSGSQTEYFSFNGTDTITCYLQIQSNAALIFTAGNMYGNPMGNNVIVSSSPGLYGFEFA